MQSRINRKIIWLLDKPKFYQTKKEYPELNVNILHSTEVLVESMIKLNPVHRANSESFSRNQELVRQAKTVTNIIRKMHVEK